MTAEQRAEHRKDFLERLVFISDEMKYLKYVL